MKELATYFSGLEDFRVQGRCLHSLPDILGLVLCAVLADCDNFVEIVDYGEDNIDFLRSDLGFCFPHGIPSVDTLERVFKYLDTSNLATAYQNLAEDISLASKQVMIDGKEFRSCIPKGKKHSLVQMLNLWVDDYNLSFGQVKVSKKSNEMKAIPQLLDLVDCKESLISIDAMACQKEIVEKIVSKEADYLIALKQNQKSLYQQAAAELLRQKPSLASFTSRDLGHGRAEERKVYVLNNLSFVEASLEWKNLNSIILVERKIYREGKEEISKSLYMSSLQEPNPEQAAQYIRKHWAIENQLHWHLDITFKEDTSSIRRENAIINLHLIRKWALHLLKKNKDKISLKRKRKKASRNNQYLKKLFSQ